MAIHTAQSPLFATPGAPAAGTQYGSTPNETLPPAQVWLNIGRVMLTANEASGEIETMFIALPKGIPLDTMPEARGTGYLSQAKNAILEEFKTACGNIPAGEEVIIGLPDISDVKLEKGQSVMLDGVFTQVKRVNDATSRPASDNPFLAAMSGSKLAVVK